MFEIIDKIRRRPGFYIGDLSLTNLFAYLADDSLRPETNVLDSKEFYQFHSWLSKKFGTCSTQNDLAKKIESQRKEKKEALLYFFELVDEYRGIQHRVLGRIRYHKKTNNDFSSPKHFGLKKISKKVKHFSNFHPAFFLIRKLSLRKKVYEFVVLNQLEEIVHTKSGKRLFDVLMYGEEAFGIDSSEWTEQYRSIPINKKAPCFSYPILRNEHPDKAIKIGEVTSPIAHMVSILNWEIDYEDYEEFIKTPQDTGRYHDAIAILKLKEEMEKSLVLGENMHFPQNEYVPFFASRLLFSGKFMKIFCDKCKEEYVPGEPKISTWSRGSGLAVYAGRTMDCPKGHTLYSIREWNT
ncbi:MAG: hypothetical protein H6581_16345 [Bacteroidia bacterium]|nr:hypothetical protein [Bacteroidia bacterium]